MIGDPPTLGVVPVPLVLLVGRAARWAAAGAGVALAGAHRRPAPRPGHGRPAARLDRRGRAGRDRAAGRAGARAARGDPPGAAAAPPTSDSVVHRRVVHSVVARSSTGSRSSLSAGRAAAEAGAQRPRRTRPGEDAAMNETYVTIRGRLTADPTVRTTPHRRADDDVPHRASARRPGAGPARAVGGHRGELLRRRRPSGRSRPTSRCRCAGASRSPCTASSGSRRGSGDDGSTRHSVEIEADAVGHDLTFGTTAFAQGRHGARRRVVVAGRWPGRAARPAGRRRRPGSAGRPGAATPTSSTADPGRGSARSVSARRRGGAERRRPAEPARRHRPAACAAGRRPRPDGSAWRGAHAGPGARGRARGFGLGRCWSIALPHGRVHLRHVACPQGPRRQGHPRRRHPVLPARRQDRRRRPQRRRQVDGPEDHGRPGPALQRRGPARRPATASASSCRSRSSTRRRPSSATSRRAPARSRPRSTATTRSPR